MIFQGWLVTDGPGERGLHRVDGLIQVVSIQTKTSLQSQRVPGSQSSHLHLGLFQQDAKELRDI